MVRVFGCMLTLLSAILYGNILESVPPIHVTSLTIAFLVLNVLVWVLVTMHQRMERIVRSLESPMAEDNLFEHEGERVSL